MKSGSKFIFLFNLLALLPALAFARGGESGGGGNAAVWRDSSGKIVRAELQDLWEAEALFGLHIPRSDMPYQQQVGTMLYRGQRANPVFIFPLFEVEPIKSDAVLPPLADADPTIVPKDGKIERLAYYDDVYQKLRVDPEIWNALGETDRAALLAHEGIYYRLRNTPEGEPDSVRSRLLVGYLASDFPLVNVRSGIQPDDPQYECKGSAELSQPPLAVQNVHHYQFTLTKRVLTIDDNPGPFYTAGVTGYVLQFSQFDNQWLISKKILALKSSSFLPVGTAADMNLPEVAWSIGEGQTITQVGPKDQISVIYTGNVAGQLHFKMAVVDGFHPHSAPQNIEWQCRGKIPLDF